MRWLVVLAILIVVPTIAVAKPKIAVAPLEGDKGNKVGNAVAEAVEDEAEAVTKPSQVGLQMAKLELSGMLDKKAAKKLRGKLEVDILIQGTVEDEGDENAVELAISGKGIKASKLKLRFKSAKSPKFKKELADALGKRVGPGETDDDDDEDRPKKPKDDEEDRPKKKRVSEEDGEDGGSVRKKKKKRRSSDDDDEETPRHAVTQTAIRLNAGAGFGRRGLTYESTGMGAPPPVGTASPSGRIEVEAYPGAMSTLKGAAAGFGLYGDYDMAFGVSIKVPMSGGKSAAISQSHYSVGARYRFAFGTSTVALGVGYAARKYTADRSGLGMVMLDMPDVSYKAIAPNAIARFAATPTVGIFVGATFLLLLDAGPIAKNEAFGYAKTLAFEATGGADIAFAKGYGLRIAAELSQVGFSFKNTVRGVSAATDRTIGAVASFEILY